ncbi:hypothetical protein Q8791_27200 [Nocardiopsis sp. CT-R113]|uniref:DUF2637 domain-containing protein n=1 Tax=Nocardiopsis codii TaxID=3065942 RepID=A0ABU7KFC6_9ACTN|nr:hypothetical protein [Nocardiopsis sp. CT-R113]MEE2040913.1 hypothetical protein [Nocardiopsis sp. CT-R113]
MQTNEHNPAAAQNEPTTPDLDQARTEPAHEDPRNEPPNQSGSALWLIPAIMTLASAVFTLWSVWDLAAHASDDLVVHAAGLAAGVVVEGGWVWMLIMAHRQAATGHVSQWNTVVGWGLAGVTAAILAAHGWQMGNWGVGMLAVLPLIAKAAWHGLTSSRAAAARKAAIHAAQEAAADDSSLTLAQRHKLAALENEATFAELEAAATIRRDDAKAKAESDAKIAQTKRQVEERLAEMDATEALRVRKAEMEERLELLAPPRRQALALGSGAYAPDDASELDDTGRGFGAGFGSAMAAQARTAQTPTLRTGPTEQVPTPAQELPKGGARTSAEEGERNAELVWVTRDRLIEETGKAPSTNALSVATGLDRRTVKRHLDKG